MRILVEPSDYPALRNLGDIAMQRIAVGRIARIWPSADIQVFSDNPEVLPHYASNVRGLNTIGRTAWMSGTLPLRRVPRPIRHWERRMRASHLKLGERLAEVRSKFRAPEESSALGSFLDITRTTDLLVVCGMGGIADTFEQYALNLLDTIALVKKNSASVVAMFGQAFGPIDDHSVVAERAREVLPQVDFIALREARASIPLLERLKVVSSRVRVTGDDALEVAAQNRRSSIGNNLGLNLRMATYSNITRDHVPLVREIVQRFALARDLALQPLPSSLYVEETDAKSILGLTEGYQNTCVSNVTDPDSLIAEVQACRVAIVGSYHAGVYALAQGVSIVGLYNSEYYRDKFLGLEALFGVGVFPVDLSAPTWTVKLMSQLEQAWEAAPSARLKLINAADRQIQLGRKAYDDLGSFVKFRLGPA